MKIVNALASKGGGREKDSWTLFSLANIDSHDDDNDRNAATDLIEQKLIYVGQEEGKLVGIRQMVQEGFQPPVLIFVQSIDRAKTLFNELIYDGINVDVIHAERTKAQRDNIVESFKAGRIWVLIATELMARGVDFKGVNLVINYDFPQSVQSYIHRIGKSRVGERERKGERKRREGRGERRRRRRVGNND